MKHGFMISVIVLGMFGIQQDGDNSPADPCRKAVISNQELIGRYQESAKAALVRDSERINRLCELTPKQMRRLEVGAGGVAKRAFAAPREEVQKLLAREELGEVAIADSREQASAAATIWNRISGHDYWKRILASTLTKDQANVLTRNERELARFRNQLWAYTVADELERNAGPLKFELRDGLVVKLTEWVQENGKPRPNPRHRLVWPTLPKEAQQLVIDALPKKALAALLKMPGLRPR